MMSLECALIRLTGVPIRGSKDTDRGKTVEVSGRGRPSKAKQGASGEANSADTLVSDVWLQDCEEIDFCCLSHSGCSPLLRQLELAQSEKPSRGCWTTILGDSPPFSSRATDPNKGVLSVGTSLGNYLLLSSLKTEHVLTSPHLLSSRSECTECRTVNLCSPRQG